MVISIRCNSNHGSQQQFKSISITSGVPHPFGPDFIVQHCSVKLLLLFLPCLAARGSCCGPPLTSVATEGEHASPSSSPNQAAEESLASPPLSWSTTHRRQFSIDVLGVCPCRRLQLFVTCPSLSPFQKVQSFRNDMLQHWSLTESQVLPANLL